MNCPSDLQQSTDASGLTWRQVMGTLAVKMREETISCHALVTA